MAVSLEIEEIDKVRGEEVMDCKVWASGEEDYKNGKCLVFIELNSNK